MTLWTERDLPILESFAEVEAAGQDRVSTDTIAGKVGRTRRDTWIGLQSLRDAGYIGWSSHVGSGGLAILIAPQILERGRRELGQWPADSYSALVAILEARIEDASDPDERGRLERFRDGLVG